MDRPRADDDHRNVVLSARVERGRHQACGRIVGVRGEDASYLVLPDHVAETVGAEQYACMVVERKSPDVGMQDKRFRRAAERLGERVTAAVSSTPIDVQRIVPAQLQHLAMTELVRATVSHIEDQCFAVEVDELWEGRW